MALSCGAKCAKGVLITFNLVFWLSGCALIAFGIYILIEEEKATLFRLFQVDESYALIQYLAYAFIGIGGLVFIVGFFGCCGAIQENKCMLVTYFIFLFLILGAELAVGILAVVFQDKVVSEMEGQLKETLRTKYGLDDPMTQAFDLAQAKFECCGIKDFTDYDDTTWKKDHLGRGDNVSKTCCVLSNFGQPEAYKSPKPVNETLCQSSNSQHYSIYRHQRHNLKLKLPQPEEQEMYPTEIKSTELQVGCQAKLEEFIREESLLFIAIGCGIAALEIFGMIFSICLCKEI